MENIERTFEQVLSGLNWASEMNVNVDDPHLLIGDNSGESRFEPIRRVVMETIGNAPDTLAVTVDWDRAVITGVTVAKSEAAHLRRVLSIRNGSVVVRSVPRSSVSRSTSLGVCDEEEQGMVVSVNGGSVLGIPSALVRREEGPADLRLLDGGVGSLARRLRNGAIDGHQPKQDVWVVENDGEDGAAGLFLDELL